MITKARRIFFKARAVLKSAFRRRNVWMVLFMFFLILFLLKFSLEMKIKC